MAKTTRRQWLKGGLVLGGLAAFGVSYRDVAKRAVDGLVNGTSGKVTLDRINGNSLITGVHMDSYLMILKEI